MNIPRLIISIVVLFVFISVFDFVAHGVILGSAYKETAESWRPEADMMARLPLQYACYLIIMIGFATVWALGFPDKGAKCGAIYGFLLGLVGTAGSILMFVFIAIPDRFMMPWIVSGMLGSILSGVLLALVYKPKAS